MTSNETTIADALAAEIGGDGRDWTRFDRFEAEAIAVEYGESRWDEDANAYYAFRVSRSDHTDGPIRHVFRDGSAIVAAGDGWDVEGDEPFSWAGASRSTPAWPRSGGVQLHSQREDYRHRNLHRS